jgi:hypothetical protein
MYAEYIYVWKERNKVENPPGNLRPEYTGSRNNINLTAFKISKPSPTLNLRHSQADL